MATSATRSVDRTVRVKGLPLHYLEWGAKEKPAVIMIHGLSGNAHNFDRLAPYFVSKYHVISVDVRGRGDSGWAKDGDYSTGAYVSDMEGLVAALGLQRFSLIGTSMGGRISMAYAGTHPGNVEKIVLNDIGPEVDTRGGQRISTYMREAPERFKDMAEVVAYYRANYPFLKGLNDAEMREYAGYMVKPHPEGGFVWKLDPAIRQDPRRPDIAQAWSWAKAITAPILLLRGAISDVLSPEVAQRMVRELHSCRMVPVPGVGHAPTLSEPEALNAIKEFFGLK